MKKIILLIGCSGSGKTTLGKTLKELGIPELISHTTRKKRNGEIDGETYYYITKQEFDKLDKLENTCYAGNFYCLSREEVNRHKKDLVYCIVDANGVNQIRDNYGQNNVYVINVHIGYGEMEKRLRNRGDSEEEIRKRLKYAYENDEIKKDANIADCILRNNDLNRAKQSLELLVNELIREMEDEKNTIF